MLSNTCGQPYLTPAGVHGPICDKLAEYCKFWLVMLKDLTKHTDRTLHITTSSIARTRNKVMAAMVVACHHLEMYSYSIQAKLLFTNQLYLGGHLGGH